MEYVNFGSAGVKVSRLALGLGFRGQADEAEGQRVIERAIDLGINLIDCANTYGPGDDRTHIGRSEVVLGKALKGKRDDMVITSKVFSRIGTGPNDQGLSRYHIMREVERSLNRLDIDHIDVYLVHNFDESTPIEETARALDDLVHQGKVRYIGCCNHSAWQACKALWIQHTLNLAPYMCMQNPYNLLHRALEREIFPFVQSEGLGIMVYSPLAVGMLSGFYKPDAPPPEGSLWAKRRMHQYETMMAGREGKVLTTLFDIANELDKTPGQVALAWVLSHPEVTVAITGGDTIAHLEDNIGGVGWTLDAALRERLDAVSVNLESGR